MNKVSEALRRATAMALRDRRMAIEILDAALREARQQADVKVVSVLARHAAVHCEGGGDLEEACAYYREAAEADPEDLWLRVAVASLLRKQRRFVEARVELSRCNTSDGHEGDEEAPAMVGIELSRLKNDVASAPDRH